ncbi:MAG: transglycosylase SLT domain-containing protein [Victivallaceae bacterium]|nr:transglycosylase SLT domain-containing protein [Victivallaceae bacterium]
MIRGWTTGFLPTICRESRFDPFKKGSKGEYGLMQILPEGAVRDWARSRHVREPRGGELFEVRTNLEIGCWYLAQGIREYRDYDDCAALALIRYNAGPARAAAWKPATRNGKADIRIASTKRYVDKVMPRYRKYQRERERPEK